jgi:hypothetical protein
MGAILLSGNLPNSEEFLMATVPGNPMDNGGIPPIFAPTRADILMAAAMHQQRQMQLAGNVIDMTGPRYEQRVKQEYGEGADPDFYKKQATRSTLMRALGGGAKVLPIKPEGD